LNRGRWPRSSKINPDLVTGVGELLRPGALQRVLQLHQRLGGKEGQAPSGAGSETRELRMGAVE
jgi:hypothetical protein